MIGKDPTVFFIEIDLRNNPVVSSDLLPRIGFEEVIVLHVKPENYSELMSSLRDICHSEGNEWMTSMLFRPFGAMPEANDLQLGETYILLAHRSLVEPSLEKFLGKLSTMRKKKMH